MGSRIEEELLAATNYDYAGSDTQEYLLGLLHAVERLDDDTYDGLTDKACGWAKKAVSAHNNRKPIPDFPDYEDVPDNEPVQEYDDEPGVGEAASKAMGADTIGDAAGEEVEADPEPVPVSAKPKRSKKPKSKPSEAKVVNPETGESVSPKDLMQLNRDKWGHVIGSKASQAMAMYEHGTTSREITQKLGGKHYNVLTEAAKQGHHVEKEGGHIKVIHKDEFGKRAKGK